MNKRVLGGFLSAASVYVTMNYLIRLFVELFSNLTIGIA